MRLECLHYVSNDYIPYLVNVGFFFNLTNLHKQRNNIQYYVLDWTCSNEIGQKQRFWHVSCDYNFYDDRG